MSDLPANVKFLIFSRPEQWITTKIPPHIKRLDLATEDSGYDVYLLVCAKLTELAEFHEWNDWPSEDQHEVEQLCELAAHQENGNLLFGTLRHLLMLSNALGGFFYLHLLSKNSKSSYK